MAEMTESKILSMPGEHERSEKFTRIFQFIPTRIENGKEFDGIPISLTVVGREDGEPNEEKELMGGIVADISAKHLAEIQNQGKIVLWNMATGKTFDWRRHLKDAFAKHGVDPTRIIVMAKEDCWDKDGKHMPPGDSLDFRGKRIESFHKLFDIEPRNVSVCPEGEIEGNLFVPDYGMSPQDGVDYMNQTWMQLINSGKVESYTTSGVGKDLHIAEMQINNMGIDRSLEQMPFFALPESDYSHARGHFKWDKDGTQFYPQSNVFVDLQEDGDFAPAGRAEEYHGFGTVMGMGWRAITETKGGALFAFDTKDKALAARMALEGAFSGRIVDQQGADVARITRDRGEGDEIWEDLSSFALDLEREGILESGIVEKIGLDNNLSLVDQLLRAIYSSYEAKRILAKNIEQRQKYFEPLWRFVNRYVGKRSPLSQQIRLLVSRGVKIDFVMTTDAATQLPLPVQD